MGLTENLRWLKEFASSELQGNILPFWKKNMVDEEFGGFYGEIDFNMNVIKEAPKGLILNSRLLWTFSAAYSLTKDTDDLAMAKRAYEYISTHFYDDIFGGYYWSVDHKGQSNDTKNQVYALAFAIYGFSEYYKVSREPDALAKAISIYNKIEEHAFDNEHNGYIDAFARDWSEMEDIRLSDGDLNSKKTMNTHLHVVEAYANLYLVWKDKGLKSKLQNLIRIFLDIITSSDSHHLDLFFDEKWNKEAAIISYGHDIEAGWLIHESAMIHGSGQLIEEVEQWVPKITDAALEGLSPIGGLYHEADRLSDHVDEELEWWPQAEAMVGLLNVYQITGDQKYMNQAMQIGRFTRDYIIDKVNGEWHYRVDKTGRPVQTYVKTGFWKCPYHNGRACIEILKRIEELQQG